jgi:hypothetical protein
MFYKSQQVRQERAGSMTHANQIDTTLKDQNLKIIFDGFIFRKNLKEGQNK